MATLREDTLIVAGVAAAVLLLAWYAKKKASDAASGLANAIGDQVDKLVPLVNPTSDQNLAYQGASAFTRWLTGRTNGDLGTITWDYVNKAEPAPGGVGYTNYTQEQYEADLKATKQLEAGFHGM